MIEVSVNKKSYSFPESGTLADVLPLLEIRQADGMMYVVKNSSRDNIGVAQRGVLK